MFDRLADEGLKTFGCGFVGQLARSRRCENRQCFRRGKCHEAVERCLPNFFIRLVQRFSQEMKCRSDRAAAKQL